MEVRVRGRRPGGKLGCGEARRWEAQTGREGVDARGCLVRVRDRVRGRGRGRVRVDARGCLHAAGVRDEVTQP